MRINYGKNGGGSRSEWVTTSERQRGGKEGNGEGNEKKREARRIEKKGEKRMVRNHRKERSEWQEAKRRKRRRERERGGSALFAMSNSVSPFVLFSIASWPPQRNRGNRE